MNWIERYDFLTQEAQTVTKSFSNNDVATFHAYNPNGLVARIERNNNLLRIFADHKAIGAKAVWLISQTEINRLVELAGKKKTNGRLLRGALALATYHVRRQDEALAALDKATGYSLRMLRPAA